MLRLKDRIRVLKDITHGVYDPLTGAAGWMLSSEMSHSLNKESGVPLFLLFFCAPIYSLTPLSICLPFLSLFLIEKAA